MNAQFEIITPDKAKNLLANSDFKNRILNDDTVARYANAMRHGKWKVNGESIIMNCNGAVMNGQHRLHAIVKSNTPVKMLIVKGISVDAFDTMDTGRKRTNGDILGIAGYTDRTNLAAALLVVHAYKTTGHFGKAVKATHNLTKKDYPPILELAKMYPELGDSVRFVHAARKRNEDLAPVSLISSIHYLLGERDDAARDDFFKTFIDGMFSGNECPVRALVQAYRSPIINSAMRLSVETRAAYWIKAWNAYKQGKQITVLRWNSERDKFPAIL